MIKFGLTGSIGMGKSTVADMFAARGVLVWDADRAVHGLYTVDGKGTEQIAKLAPSAIGDEGVDRKMLSSLIAGEPDLLAKIEAIIHPLVAEDREAFTKANFAQDFLLFDIPLLFERGSESEFDYVITVSATPEIQKSRVLTRAGMTEDKFAMILSRQMSDAEKRSRADFVVENSGTLAETEAQVDAILKALEHA